MDFLTTTEAEKILRVTPIRVRQMIRGGKIEFADACLVRMSKLIDNAAVFTLDGNFYLYRKHGRKKIDFDNSRIKVKQKVRKTV